MKTKRPITAEEQEFFDSMELNIQRKQVTYLIVYDITTSPY